MNKLQSFPYSKELSKFLISFLEKKQIKFADQFWSKDVFDRLKKFVCAGKMLRGNLFLNYYFLENNSKKIKKEELFKIAAFFELFQSGIIIQDDVFDQDDQRREQDSFHKQYRDFAKKNQISSEKRFGESMAVLVGDISYFLAFDLLNSTNLDPDLRQQLFDLCLTEFNKVFFAEQKDVTVGFSKIETNLEEILDIYKSKTGRYTIVLPFLVAAILRGDSSEKQELIEKNGEDLGVVFQIKDDELGILGTSKQIGKSVGGDVKQNKKTIWRYFVEQLDQDKKVIALFGKQDLTEKDFQKVRSFILDNQIKQKVDNKVKKLVKEIQTNLASNCFSIKEKEFFEDLLKFSLNRIK